MRRPRITASQSADPETQGMAAPHSQPDPTALLREIDVGIATVGIATVEATLTDLERESDQFRHRLAQISGTATLFELAGLVDEAAAMHDVEQSIADALADNERRRETTAQTEQKPRAAREQLIILSSDVLPNSDF